MSLYGDKPFAVLLCKFADQPQEPQSAKWFEGFITGPSGLASYWSWVSNGQFPTKGTQILGWTKLTTKLADFQQHIFYRTTDNQIWHVFYDANKGLLSEQWATSGSAVGDLATLAANSQQDVFYVSDVSPLGQADNFGALMRVFWDPNDGVR